MCEQSPTPAQYVQTTPQPLTVGFSSLEASDALDPAVASTEDLI